jgi:hypothetical protein
MSSSGFSFLFGLSASKFPYIPHQNHSIALTEWTYVNDQQKSSIFKAISLCTTNPSRPFSFLLKGFFFVDWLNKTITWFASDLVGVSFSKLFLHL